MWIPIALILGLLVATAVIAHVSDTLGKRLGKKRVSVFGLRPRHSATVLTVASSWGIMGFTMLVLLGVYAPLKNAIFHYESERARLTLKTQQVEERLKIANANLEVTNSTLKTVAANLQTSQQSIVGLQKQKRQAQEQTQTARDEEQLAQKKLRSARLGEQSARRAVLVAQKTVYSAQTSAQKAQRAEGSARAQQQVAQKLLNGTRSSLQTTETRLGTAQDSLNAAQKRLVRAQLQLRKADAELKRASSEIVAANKARLVSFKETIQAKQQADRDVAQAKQEVDDLQTQKSDLQKQVNFLGEAATTYRQVSEQLAIGDIRLPVDQTLAERRLDAEQNPEQIEKELRYLVETGQAATTKNFLPGAVVVANSTITDPDKSGKIELDEAQTIQFYADRLALINRPVSARLVSVFNYPVGEKVVLARFVFVPIRTIYASRENITEGVIEADKSEAAVFGQLQKLVDSARFNAVKRGASPPLSPDVQNFFDGDTGSKLFDALRQVQKVGHPVSVRIVAARDLDSAEPLQVRFVVGEET